MIVRIPSVVKSLIEVVKKYSILEKIALASCGLAVTIQPNADKCDKYDSCFNEIIFC